MVDRLLECEEILRKENFDCALSLASEDADRRLLVLLNTERLQEERIVEIVVDEQKIGDFVCVAIQFQCVFPVEVDPGAVFEMGSLLHFINRFLDLPGFELSEMDQKVFYRYVWLTSENQGIAVGVLKTIVSLIALLMELFSEPIMQVAQGRTTFTGLLDQVMAILDKIKVEE